MRQERSAWLHRLAVLTAGATFLLIVVGALVVGHGAGLSVPDWPLSYGMLMPPMEGGVLYEHGHRLIAALVGVLMTLLAGWLWWAEPRRWLRWLGVASLLAVIAQAVLGGITVLYLLPIPVLVGHAALAQLFFCMTLSLALVTSPAWDSRPEAAGKDLGSPEFRYLSTATTVAIFVQLILGAARRHRALSLVPHLVWAGVVTVMVLRMVYLGLNKLPATQKLLRDLSLMAGLLLAMQLALGFGSYWLLLVVQGAPQSVSAVIWMTTAHVSVGALLLGDSLLLTLLAYRKLAAPGKALSFSQSPQKIVA